MAHARHLAIGGFAGCLLAAHLLRAALPLPPAPAPSALPLVHQGPPRSPSEAARRESQRHWMRALSEAGGQLEVLAEWDPQADAGCLEGRQWQALICRSAEVPLARRAARRTAELARNDNEAFRAARLLALIECSTGHHQEELQQARRLVALLPHDEGALLWLRRAARCNHLPALERRAEDALAALRSRPEHLSPGSGGPASRLQR
jgi:hypothetical protein